MIFKILKHDWLAFKRSPMLSQSIGQNIFLALIGLYFLLTFLSLGIGGGFILKEFFPEADIKKVVYEYLLYWWIFDVLLRFMMQKFPSITLKRYLTLNISRKTICHFMVSRSLVSFFNLLPFFFFIPFYFITLSSEMGALEGRSFMMMAVSYTHLTLPTTSRV